MIEQFKHYYRQAKLMQEYKFQGMHEVEEVYGQVDELIWNVPIYDVVNRRYAAFSSFVEAIWYKEKDPKGNGTYFTNNTVPRDYDFPYLCYLFRLVGSGINYKPISEDTPWHKSHGFGNFWVVDLIRSGYYRADQWLDRLPANKFSNNKGYIIPQFKKKLRNFILDDSKLLFEHLWNYVNESDKPRSIIDVVEHGNAWLRERGFNRQNFVLTAFAMDLAEYYPHLVDPFGDVLFGTNAKQCYKMIFPGESTSITKMNENVRKLCEITGGHSLPYDMEDVMCDFIRYTQNYQSDDHIKLNNGITYKNSL